MGSRPEYEEAKMIAELDERSRRPRLLYIALIWDVHERDESGEAAVLARRVHDLHVLVDRYTGRRIVVRDADLDEAHEFKALAREAELVELRYSVTEKQIELILDTAHRVIFASGGERGGKTQALALWIIRTWLIVGGLGVKIWWVAPTLEQTRIGVEKLVAGEDERPGLLPPVLVLRYPEAEHSRDQAIVLIDGTKIELRYATGRRKGGNLKGRGPRAIGVDEACEIPDIKTWKIIRGRVNERNGHKGQIFLSSTPEEGHWIEREVVARVDRGEAPNYTYGHLTAVDNAFVKRSEVEEMIRDKGGEDDPQVQREVFGRWRSSQGRVYYRFDLRVSCRDFGSLDELGLVDVTAAVMRSRIRKLAPRVAEAAVVGGQDFNLGFCVTTLARFGVPKGTAYKTERDVVVVFVDELVTREQGYEEHGHALLRQCEGPIPIAVDATGAQGGASSSLTAESKRAKTPARELARAGHHVIACHYADSGEPANPPQLDSIAQVNRLARETLPVQGGGSISRMIVHRRCHHLLESFQLVQRAHDGRIDKKAGTESDRLTAASDAARYLLAYFLPESLAATQERAAA